MLIELRRAGKFKATTMRPDNHKCAAMKTKTYRYDVTLCADSRRLTKEGFLLNNELVQEFFDTKFGEKAKPWDAISCERMALTSAQDFVKILSTQYIRCKFVTVTIFGSNGAAITARWGAE